MNELRGSRESQALARRYNSPDDPLQTIASDLFPTVSVADGSCDAELHFLKASKLCAGFVFDAAPGVGVLGQAGLLNQSPTGVLVVVDAISVTNTLGAARQYSLRTGPTQSFSPDGTAAGFLRDSRWGTSRSAALLVTFSNAAATGDRIDHIFVPTGTTVRFSNLPLVLAPGGFFLVSAITANEEVDVAVSWRERRLELGEGVDQ